MMFHGTSFSAENPRKKQSTVEKLNVDVSGFNGIQEANGGGRGEGNESGRTGGRERFGNALNEIREVGGNEDASGCKEPCAKISLPPVLSPSVYAAQQYEISCV